MNGTPATIGEMPAVVPSPNQIPFFEELVAPPRAPTRPHLRIQPPLLADLTARQRKAAYFSTLCESMGSEARFPELVLADCQLNLVSFRRS